MKKTLIALAVAASAAVSGSAMAWTANGTGGSVDLGGTLSPVQKITPWEVMVGGGASGLDAQIQKGQTEASISVTTAISVLGIRTQSAEAFQGQPGIAPQIDYGNAIDVSQFKNGRVPLTLEMKNASDVQIGTLTTEMGASLMLSYKTSTFGGYNHEYAPNVGDAFYGGLPTTAAETPDADIASLVVPDVGVNFSKQGQSSAVIGKTNALSDPNFTYSAYYGSGIESGKTIKLTLTQAATGDETIQWKASLPVTVSYQ